MNAPCARFTMFMIPQTSENPSATSARIPLRRRAWTKIWPSSAPPTRLLPLVPGRHRVESVLFRHGRREYRVFVAVRLELLDRHRLERVDAAAVEFDLPVERHDVQGGDLVAYLRRVECARLLDRSTERDDGGRRFRDLVGDVPVLRVLRPEGHGVAFRRLPRVAAVVLESLGPLRGAEDVVGVRLQVRAKLRRGRSDREAHRLRRDAEVLRLLHDEKRVLQVSGAEYDVGILALDVRQQRADVLCARRVELLVDDLKALLPGVVRRAARDFFREWLVFPEHRHGPDALVLRHHEVDDAFEVELGGGEHRERVLVALAENRLGRSVRLDHRDLVLLADRRGRARRRRSVRAEDERDLVLVDQLLDELGRALGFGLVVVVLHGDLVFLSAQNDPTLGVKKYKIAVKYYD